MSSNILGQRVSRNRLANVSNGYQGEPLRVLTVCSAGVLRSPTAAHILSSAPYNFNTRCGGINKDYALVHVDVALVAWAQLIICMDEDQAAYINKLQQELVDDYSQGFNIYPFKPVYIMNIEDNFAYRDPKLVEQMTETFQEYFVDRIK